MLVEGMLECERRIVRLEEAIGYQTGEMDTVEEQQF